MGDRVRMIYVEVKDPKALDDTILQIQLLLAKRHNVSLDAPDPCARVFTGDCQDRQWSTPRRRQPGGGWHRQTRKGEGLS